MMDSYLPLLAVAVDDASICPEECHWNNGHGNDRCGNSGNGNGGNGNRGNKNQKTSEDEEGVGIDDDEASSDEN